MFDLENKLKTIKKNNLFRTFTEFTSPQYKKVKTNTKNNILLFSSNNYLDLCNNDYIKNLSIKTITKFGVGSGGSRLTTGTTILHTNCERTISDFKNKEASLLYSSGYLCNLGSISSLFYEDYLIFSDELNHASIISGIKLSKSKCIVYKHLDMDDLYIKLKENSNFNKKIIITDGVFSMDGDICKLDILIDLCYKFNCYLYIDDAHATGVLGESGMGTCEHFNIFDERIILMGTGSKALGCVGGFISSTKTVVEYLKNTSKSFIFSTSQTPENANTLCVSIKKSIQMTNEREHLKNLSNYLKNKLIDIGFNITNGQTPIIGLILKHEQLTINFQKELLKNNIYVTPIRPPSVPKNTCRLRITLNSSHTIDDLDYLISCLKNLYLKYKVYKGE